MRFFTVPAILSAFVVVGLLGGVDARMVSVGHGGALASRHHKRDFLFNSIFTNPKGQSGLPSLQQASTSPNSLNLQNIQSDILTGVKKKQQLFFFFNIKRERQFRKALSSQIKPRITTVAQLLDETQLANSAAVNIAFSQAGLQALRINQDLGDDAFANGQASDASSLGDPGTSNWVSAFTSGVHGVFLITSDTVDKINTELSTIQSILGNSMVEVYRLQAAARPGDQEGHEHFGFLDGISQPALEGFNQPNPGQAVVQPGVIILGETGDDTTRPPWTKDGSFLAFRQLRQFVPEFQKFVDDNAIVAPDLNFEQGSALFGARLFGRFKSGAPIDLTPRFDDPVLAADPSRNNNFTFLHPDTDSSSDQTRCPFSAHIRKSNPRSDLDPQNSISHHIMRSSIPYGPELTSDEISAHTTSTDRGLAFVSYQSDLSNGFRFQQQSWANNIGFPVGKNTSRIGFDPITGENGGNSRFVSGVFPNNVSQELTLPMDFVVSKGGEYFFVPPVDALSGPLGL